MHNTFFEMAYKHNTGYDVEKGHNFECFNDHTKCFSLNMCVR